MFELVKAGGWLMAPIIACSVVALAIIVERAWSLREKQVVPDYLVAEVWRQAREGKVTEEQVRSLREHSPLGRILAVGLLNRQRERAVIKEAIEESGRAVAHELDRFLTALGTIAAITPLLGLLGTVIGMISVFTTITQLGVGNPGELAGGISQALHRGWPVGSYPEPDLPSPFPGQGRVPDRADGAGGREAGRNPVRRARAISGEPRGVNFRTRPREEIELNITPLIDIVFLLLIFFMVSTTFQTQSQLRVQLPEAQQSAESEPTEPLEIVISADGQYAVDGRELTDNQRATLVDALARAIEAGSDRPLVVRADSRTPHEAVVRAMDVAGQLGLDQLSIATARERSE